MENKGLPIETQKPQIAHAEYAGYAEHIHHADCVRYANVKCAGTVGSADNVEHTDKVENVGTYNVVNNYVTPFKGIFERAEEFEPSKSTTSLSYDSLLKMAEGMPERIEIDARDTVNTVTHDYYESHIEAPDGIIRYDLRRYLPSELMPYINKIIVAGCNSHGYDMDEAMEHSTTNGRSALAVDGVQTAILVKTGVENIPVYNKRLHDRAVSLYYSNSNGSIKVDDAESCDRYVAGMMYTNMDGRVASYWNKQKREAMFTLFGWGYVRQSNVYENTWIKCITIQNGTDDMPRYLDIVLNVGEECSNNDQSDYNVNCNEGSFFVYFPKQEIINKIKELNN